MLDLTFPLFISMPLPPADLSIDDYEPINSPESWQDDEPMDEGGIQTVIITEEKPVDYSLSILEEIIEFTADTEEEMEELISMWMDEPEVAPRIPSIYLDHPYMLPPSNSKGPEVITLEDSVEEEDEFPTRWLPANFWDETTIQSDIHVRTTPQSAPLIPFPVQPISKPTRNIEDLNQEYERLMKELEQLETDDLCTHA